ncbi:gluconate 2-dehydrogenase subunit 3 family protein [Pseudoxanthomonas sp.]|uniref:gluconate 2-dehydrogenase subunit 3 family protein n=1 Tax=Pseudoxanthomonas sp. TaxID=1871049 RepID=UPI0026386F01|nr:gluconate 2-dehydrogenase subunit 3 family protein [Pseudoxanthomonas sp.]WDS37785.1 MAG: gluconate 2-dehydrogenase subunit 3 family protein [Pseudoxanthomonas sp.]
MERRALLKMIAVATGMAMIGRSPLVYGQAQLPVSAANNVFSDTEVAKLDEIAETILPRTETPGAKEAGVGLFMAQFVSDCYTPEQQAVFRAGLADIDKRAGGRFLAMRPKARTELLHALDNEAKAQALGDQVVPEGGTPEVRQPHYFTMIKQLVIFGFFTSTVGATQVLRYEAVPGRYDGDLHYAPGTPAWATN